MGRHRRCDSGRKGAFERKPFIIQALAMLEQFKRAQHLVVPSLGSSVGTVIIGREVGSVQH